MENLTVFGLEFTQAEPGSIFYDNKDNRLYLINFGDRWEANSSEYSVGAIGNTPEEAFSRLVEDLRACSKSFLKRISKFENLVYSSRSTTNIPF